MTSHLRAILISVAVAALTTLVVVIVAYLSVPVTGLRVEGARMYPESDAWDAVSQHASLLTLNEDRLEQKVKAHPWVQGAEVYGDWRSGIVTVQVEEYRPVLDVEVAGERRIFAPDGTELPGLGGMDLEKVRLGEDQLQDVFRFGRVLQEHGVGLESVDAVGPGGISATVEGRRVIFADAVTEEQVEALKDVMDRHPQAAALDLRSPGRIVVAGSPNAGSETGSRG